MFITVLSQLHTNVDWSNLILKRKTECLLSNRLVIHNINIMLMQSGPLIQSQTDLFAEVITPLPTGLMNDSFILLNQCVF